MLSRNNSWHLLRRLKQRKKGRNELSSNLFYCTKVPLKVAKSLTSIRRITFTCFQINDTLRLDNAISYVSRRIIALFPRRVFSTHSPWRRSQKKKTHLCTITFTASATPDIQSHGGMTGHHFYKFRATPNSSVVSTGRGRVTRRDRSQDWYPQLENCAGDRITHFHIFRLDQLIRRSLELEVNDGCVSDSLTDTRVSIWYRFDLVTGNNLLSRLSRWQSYLFQMWNLSESSADSRRLTT